MCTEELLQNSFHEGGCHVMQKLLVVRKKFQFTQNFSGPRQVGQARRRSSQFTRHQTHEALIVCIAHSCTLKMKSKSEVCAIVQCKGTSLPYVFAASEHAPQLNSPCKSYTSMLPQIQQLRICYSSGTIKSIVHSYACVFIPETCCT